MNTESKLDRMISLLVNEGDENADSETGSVEDLDYTQEELDELRSVFVLAGSLVAEPDSVEVELDADTEDRIRAAAMRAYDEAVGERNGNPIPPKPVFLRAITLVVTAAVSLLIGVWIGGMFEEEPHSPSVGTPLVAAYPIASQQLAAGSDRVEVEDPTRFLVGPSFRLVIRSSVKGFVTIILVDEEQTRVLAEEKEIDVANPFETKQKLHSSVPEGSALVLITPNPVHEILSNAFPEDAGFAENQIPGLKTRVREILAEQDFVGMTEFRLRRRPRE